ncbi:hypothetical protein ACOME3_007836 [Neoechinorhynchus agilis]
MKSLSRHNRVRVQDENKRTSSNVTKQPLTSFCYETPANNRKFGASELSNTDHRTFISAAGFSAHLVNIPVLRTNKKSRVFEGIDSDEDIEPVASRYSTYLSNLSTRISDRESLTKYENLSPIRLNPLIAPSLIELAEEWKEPSISLPTLEEL